MTIDLFNQRCSSRRTSRSVIEKHDIWVVWRYHWIQRYRPLFIQYTGKMREYWLKKEKLILKHDVPQHRKDRNSLRKSTTNLIRPQNHNAKVVERSWFCFSPSQTCVYCFTCRLMCADTTMRISLLEKESANGRTLRTHGHSMEHIHATITFSRICN